jgi:hypothetical protein
LRAQCWRFIEQAEAGLYNSDRIEAHNHRHNRTLSPKGIYHVAAHDPGPLSGSPATFAEPNLVSMNSSTKNSIDLDFTSSNRRDTISCQQRAPPDPCPLSRRILMTLRFRGVPARSASLIRVWHHGAEGCFLRLTKDAVAHRSPVSKTIMWPPRGRTDHDTMKGVCKSVITYVSNLYLQWRTVLVLPDNQPAGVGLNP